MACPRKIQGDFKMNGNTSNRKEQELIEMGFFKTMQRVYSSKPESLYQAKSGALDALDCVELLNGNMAENASEILFRGYENNKDLNSVYWNSLKTVLKAKKALWLYDNFEEKKIDEKDFLKFKTAEWNNFMMFSIDRNFN